MTRVEIESAVAQVVAAHGPWTAHNVHLGDGVFTLGVDKPYLKLQRLVQVAADVCGRPLADLRVLDLACLEGGFAIEFARHGATVVGIEGREANLAKARLARVREGGVENIRFGWAGSTERGRQHYYRIQGPRFLIEYDASQNDGNHIHTVWRDFSGDFGRDLLRQHYSLAKGSSHRHQFGL